MKKFLSILLLAFLLSGNTYAKDLKVIWDVELDSGQAYKIQLLDGNYCNIVGTDGSGCSYTSNGNKVYINVSNSVFIMKGLRTYFSNKIKGTWRSTGTNTQGKFWGYEEKM